MTLIVWLIVAPGRRASWTGFGQQNLWEWMELLIIPVVLAAGAYLFNRAERKLDREIAAQRANTDREIATDRAQEGLSQAYLDRMSELLLKERLRTSKSESETRDIARARTLTVLRQLDGARTGILLQFLYESKLINQMETEQENSVNAQDTKGVIINLSGADLRGADLRGAVLTGTDLSQAALSHAGLSGAYLRYANLSGANLEGANLSGASLWHANLSGANLTAANLGCADLGEDRPRCADLSEADLSDATGCTNEQLAQAESLVEAIMPDGTIMTEEAWEEFKKRYRK
jgi:hypothetical protein